MKAQTKLQWLNGMTFDAELNGHHFIVDAEERVGGRDLGPRPKGLVLSALAGCTGMDVVSILKKMKIENYELIVNVEADQTTEHPKVYQNIVVKFLFTGENLPVEKLKRAVELSETRYCGVTAMLKKSTSVTSKIILNGEEV
ncbi:MAG: OsmC family peroxiredoxin [Candidatus Cloacimonadota bacterium]|nr:MAG: OsmC family peroxiredoxin [Candidatus Cloacimonadota bacterium]